MSNSDKTDSHKLQKNREFESIIPKKNNGNRFGTLVYRPKGTFFATQNPGEKVFVLVRQFWLINLGWILRNSFYAVIPFITYSILNLLNLRIPENLISQRIIALILLAYYSILFSNVYRLFVDWYFDVFIITNERVVDYDFKPFTNYTVKEAELENIEDVSEASKGPIASIFDYGDITATTASETGALSLEKIPSPTKVRDVLMDLSKIAKKYSDGN